jgi:hypothetical protein
VPHPHDQRVAIFISPAICRAESAFHFTTSYHALLGWSPSRPPVPTALWKPSISPIFVTGIPIFTYCATERRKAARMRRFATTEPERYSTFALK